jgi:mRNA interferase MazF
MKLRPVLLLTGRIGSVPEVLVAYISSVLPTQPLASDLIMDPSTPEFEGTHLKVVSALRLHKLATIHSSSVVRHLGALDANQFGVVGDKLRALLGMVPASPVASPR